MKKETKLRKMFKRDKYWDDKLYSRYQKGKLSPLLQKVLNDKIIFDNLNHKLFREGYEEMWSDELGHIYNCEEKYGWR